MRATHRPLLAVNTEIWTHKVYELRGVFDAAYPLPEGFVDAPTEDLTADLTLARGEPQEFVIAPGFGSEVQTIEWRLNGEKLEGATGGPIYTMPASQADNYVLSVSARDDTDAVRVDPDGITSRTFTWQVTLADSVADTVLSTVRRKANARSGHGSTVVRFDWSMTPVERHELVEVERIAVATRPSHFPYANLDELVEYEVRQANGKVLYQGTQGIGRMLRSAALPDGTFADHAIIYQDSGSYTIRFPYSRHATTLVVRKAGSDEWQRFSL